MKETKHVLTSDAELYHYGVKGMKWGMRKARQTSNAQAEQYSQKQRIRDKKLYGKNSEKRINNKMLKGEGIQSARHDEVKRRERIAKAKKGAEKTAKALVKIGNTYVMDQMFFGGAMTRATKTAIKNIGRFTISAFTYAGGGRDIQWFDN